MAEFPTKQSGRGCGLLKGWFQDTLLLYHGKIAMLHLDGDLYDSRWPLATLYDKVSSGGIIMFDEDLDSRWSGATKAIDEFFVDKLEKVQPHERCHWKYFVQKR